MTAVSADAPTGWRARRTAVEVPALSGSLQVTRAALLALFVISVSLLLELVVVSGLQQRAAQQRAYDRLRAELAMGTAPIGPTDVDGRRLAPGAPVAYLEIPSIGLRQVILEGTTPGTLFSGPGHRRDSPLPGQVGGSVVMGRSSSFGGPFARIEQLDRGALIHVTTGQGEFDYRVTGVRAEGDPVPAPPKAGEGRLMLATAAGRPFMPDGVLRVDADLETDPVGGAAPLLTTAELPQSEQLMGADTSTLWALVLWLELLIVLTIGAVWTWKRWGRAQAWLIFLPPLVLVGLATAGSAARLMPNLL